MRLHLKLLDVDYPLTFEVSKLRQIKTDALIYLSTKTTKILSKTISKSIILEKTVRSVCHQLGSYELNKISLSCFDDKRHILADGKTSYPYGHYKIIN